MLGSNILMRIYNRESLSGPVKSRLFESDLEYLRSRGFDCSELIRNLVRCHCVRLRALNGASCGLNLPVRNPYSLFQRPEKRKKAAAAPPSPPPRIAYPLCEPGDYEQAAYR